MQSSVYQRYAIRAIFRGLSEDTNVPTLSSAGQVNLVVDAKPLRRPTGASVERQQVAVSPEGRRCAAPDTTSAVPSTIAISYLVHHDGRRQTERQRVLPVGLPRRSGCNVTFWTRQLFMSATISSFSEGHARE